MRAKIIATMGQKGKFGLAVGERVTQCDSRRYANQTVDNEIDFPFPQHLLESRYRDAVHYCRDGQPGKDSKEDEKEHKILSIGFGNQEKGSDECVGCDHGDRSPLYYVIFGFQSV